MLWRRDQCLQWENLSTKFEPVYTAVHVPRGAQYGTAGALPPSFFALNLDEFQLMKAGITRSTRLVPKRRIRLSRARSCDFCGIDLVLSSAGSDILYQSKVSKCCSLFTVMVKFWRNVKFKHEVFLDISGLVRSFEVVHKSLPLPAECC